MQSFLDKPQRDWLTCQEAIEKLNLLKVEDISQGVRKHRAIATLEVFTYKPQPGSWRSKDDT